MKSLYQFLHKMNTIPAITAYYLAEISEAKGKQELYAHQSPQKLQVLLEHALIESTVSSNRIEGVEIERSRVGTVIFGHPVLKNRSEEEILGYRNALNKIHTNYSEFRITNNMVKNLHKLLKDEVWDSGEYRQKSGNIIQTYSNGRSRIRFKTLEPAQINNYMKKMISIYNDLKNNNTIHPLLVSIAFDFDFLCIHPFRDGNGRVSRLLFLLKCHKMGYHVGKYISLEKLIENNKERYYETLEMSSQNWRQGKHSPWHYINFMLYILKAAYKEFEERAGKLSVARGIKTELVLKAITNLNKEFSIKELESKCPSVSREMIRKVLKTEKKKGAITCISKGPGAKWHKQGNVF